MSRAAPNFNNPHASTPGGVSVRHLTKRFPGGGLPAVDDAGFDAPTGGITSLLGPSGSGKTTVLRMIAGLEEPDSGLIKFSDEDITRKPVRRRGVGFVFQGYALFANMTVRENIAFGLQMQKAPKAEIEARVEELIGLVQLGTLGDRYPRQLSGGQQQRVAFARALAPRPKVLLLDEPFGALDVKVRVELREWLRRLHDQMHVTTILVTHDQEEALELSEHVVVMKSGKVEQAGTPHDLYDKPATAFVASFVGGASVLRGTIEGGRASLGPLSVKAPEGAVEGTAVEAYVRPHDVQIKPAPAPTASTPGAVSHAKIERIVRVGGQVKLELTISTGEAITVQRSKAEIDALGVKEGDSVLVDLVSAQVFLEDYAI